MPARVSPGASGKEAKPGHFTDHAQHRRAPFRPIPELGEHAADQGVGLCALPGAEVGVFKDGVKEVAGAAALRERKQVQARCSSGVRPARFRASGLKRAQPVAVRCIAGRAGAGRQRGIARNSPGPVDLPCKLAAAKRCGVIRRRPRSFQRCIRQRPDVDRCLGPRHQRFQILHEVVIGLGFQRPFHALDDVRVCAVPGITKVEQVRQRGGLGGVDAAPHEVAALLGAREGHIEQPQVLGERLCFGVSAAERGILAAQVEREAAVGGRVVEEDLLTAGAGTGPGKRAEHHAVLQPLALVDGHDLDRRFIAFEPELVFLEPRRRRVALFGEPLQQAGHPEVVLAGGVVQQLPDVQKIGQAPFAVRETQQPLFHALPGQQAAKHGHEPLPVPDLKIVPCPGEAFLPPVRLPVGRRDVVRMRAQDVGGERGLKPADVGGVGHAGEDALHVLGLAGVEDVAGAANHRGDAGGGQALLHDLGLRVRAHQHGDVTGRQRVAPAPASGAEFPRPRRWRSRPGSRPN